MPIVIAVLVLVGIAIGYFYSHQKMVKRVQEDKKNYHVDLSDTIQKAYFDEYDKEQAKAQEENKESSEN